MWPSRYPHCCGRSVQDSSVGALLKPLACKSATAQRSAIKWLQATPPPGHSQFPSKSWPCMSVVAITVYGGCVFFLLRKRAPFRKKLPPLIGIKEIVQSVNTFQKLESRCSCELDIHIFRKHKDELPRTDQLQIPLVIQPA